MYNLQKLLNFQPVESSPVMTCNACGNDLSAKYMAVIHPFDDQSHDYSMVACSDGCKNVLLSEDYLEPVTWMMLESVSNISQQFNLNVNDEWHSYFQNINNGNNN